MGRNLSHLFVPQAASDVGPYRNEYQLPAAPDVPRLPPARDLSHLFVPDQPAAPQAQPETREELLARLMRGFPAPPKTLAGGFRASARGAAQSATIGAVDEIVAGLGSAVGLGNYDDNLQRYRAADQAARAEEPESYGRAAAVAPAGPLRLVGKAVTATATGKILTSGLLGAAGGALSSDGDAGDRARGAAVGLGLGLTGGAIATGKAVPALKKVAEVVKDPGSLLRLPGGRGAAYGGAAGAAIGEPALGAAVGAGAELLARGASAAVRGGASLVDRLRSKINDVRIGRGAQRAMGNPALAPTPTAPVAPPPVAFEVPASSPATPPAVELAPPVPRTSLPAPVTVPAAPPAAPPPLELAPPVPRTSRPPPGEPPPAAPAAQAPPPPAPAPAPAPGPPPKKLKILLGDRVATPEELAQVTSGGAPLEQAGLDRMGRMRNLKHLDLYADKDPVRVAVSPGGRMEVEGGRHRILAARERGAPLRVKFVRGSKELDAPPADAPDAPAAPGKTGELADIIKGHQAAKVVPKDDQSTVDALVNIVSSRSRAGGIPNERHFPVEPHVAFKEYLANLPTSTGGTAAGQHQALKALTVGRYKGADVGTLIYQARAAGVPDEQIMRAVGVLPGKAPPTAPPAPRVPTSDQDLAELLRQSVGRAKGVP